MTQVIVRGKKKLFKTMNEAINFIDTNAKMADIMRISIDDMRSEFIQKENWFPSDNYIRRWFLGYVGVTTI